MPRPTTRNSDDSDDDNALEAEYDKLQLNYKVSEQQRLQYSIEVQKKIRLQKYTFLKFTELTFACQFKSFFISVSLLRI